MSNHDDLIDTRTRAEKIGDIMPKRLPPSKSVTMLSTTPATPSQALQMSIERKMKRHAARDLALDYAEWAILALVDTAKTTKNEPAKVECLKHILNYALGRPSTVHVDKDAEQVIPNFTIVFGDNIQQIEIPNPNKPEEFDDASED